MIVVFHDHAHLLFSLIGLGQYPGKSLVLSEHNLFTIIMEAKGT